MTRPRLLDLFCCAGGAGMGYHRAGFDVVGVDRAPQPRYPFAFVQADALEYAAAHWHEFDAVHASPPCQAHTRARSINGRAHPDLLPATRALLQSINLPWVIENVAGAPMPGALVLCGTEFGLTAKCGDGVTREVRRHRQFESNTFLMGAGGCQHRRPVLHVFGHGGGGWRTRKSGRNEYEASAPEKRLAMGIDWTTRDELSEAIPPAFTEFLGEQIMSTIRAGQAASAR